MQVLSEILATRCSEILFWTKEHHFLRAFSFTENYLTKKIEMERDCLHINTLTSTSLNQLISHRLKVTRANLRVLVVYKRLSFEPTFFERHVLKREIFFLFSVLFGTI